MLPELTTDHELYLHVILRTTKLKVVLRKGVWEPSFVLNLLNKNNYPSNQIVYLSKI